MTKIAVLVGSLQEKSFNKMLAKNLELVAPEGVEFEYIDINLPLLNQDLEVNFPTEVSQAKATVEAADGVLFVTPEYNHNIPGALKNAIDWISRPYADNSFAGKPAGIVGASPTPGGTRNVQPKLRDLLNYLQLNVLEQPEVYIATAHEVFDENDAANDDVKQRLTSYMQAFSSWIHSEK